MQIVTLAHATDQEAIQTAVECLKAGGLLIFPTETTYGAGVDATNQEAVNKLLAYKSRREGKPLSIAVTDLAMAERYVEVNDSAKRLYERFLPGPVTVVSKSKNVVAEGVASEYGTIGIRMSSHPLIAEIVKAFGKPVTATSANGSGEKRPYTIQDIFDGLSEKQKSLIDVVLDAGTLPPNPPSTVIDTTLDTPVIFRQGDIKAADTSGAQTFESTSEDITKEIAQRLLLKYWNDVKEKGLLVLLQGSLGVGKTVFVKGLADSLAIKEDVTSPTYTYVQQYNFTRHGFAGELYHYDLWRLEKPEMIKHLDLSSALQAGNVVAIEWPSVASEQLANLAQKHGIPVIDITLSDNRDISFALAQSATYRKITVIEPNSS
jgi:L-threonylcarbamoyladenylate synthase